MKKILVTITVVGTVDACTTMPALKDFVDDALSTWGGQRHPDDPLFDSVDVRHVRIIKVGRIDL